MKKFDTHQLRTHAEDFTAEMEEYGEEVNISLLLSFVEFLDGFDVSPIEGAAEGLELEGLMTSCNKCGDFYEESDNHEC